jgi:predicted ATPase
MAAFVAIHELVKNRSQFAIATHSPILLAYQGALILRFDEQGIEKISYQETEDFPLAQD